MKPRFLADSDLNLQIVLALKRREPGLDFRTANEAGLSGLPDPAVLSLAAAEGRILVSHDRRTMPGYFADFISTQSSPGLFLVPQKMPVSQVVEEMIFIWALSEDSEWVNRIVGLPL